MSLIKQSDGSATAIAASLLRLNIVYTSHGHIVHVTNTGCDLIMSTIVVYQHEHVYRYPLQSHTGLEVSHR